MDSTSPACPASFTQIKLQRLDIICEQSLAQAQYTLILDSTAKADMYFSYKATLVEFQKEHVACAMREQTKREACEKLRKQLVHCMRVGDRLVIFLDKCLPNFQSDYNFPPDTWPSHDIFNFEKWRTNDLYMSVVKSEEDHDVNNNRGQYFMHDFFQIVVLATYQGEQDAKKIVDLFPHAAKMAKYMIIP